MKTALKIFAGIIAVGLITCLIGLFIVNFNLKEIKAIFIEDDDYTLMTETSDYSAEDIYIKIYNKNIEIIESNDESFHISYYTSEKHKISYSEDNNKISLIEEKAVYNSFLGFCFPAQKVKKVLLSLPASFEGNLDINTSNAKITMNDLGTFGNINFDTSNGNIEFSNMSTNSLNLDTSNGSINIFDITCNSTIKLATSNSDINIRNIECNNLDITTSNSEIMSNNIIAVAIVAETSNGDIEMKNILSNDIDLRTTNDDIEISLKGKIDDYKIDINTSNGKNKINGIIFGNQIINSNAPKRIKAKTTNSDITIDFV